MKWLERRRELRRLKKRWLREYPTAGVHVISSKMADDYTPPSASLNPTAPSTPEPQEMVSKLVGHRVRLTLTTGTKREGTVLGCGPQGFQLTSGIGGRMIFYYSEVDGIDDLGEAK